MRPVSRSWKWKMHFGYGKEYPPELWHLTADHRHHGQDYLTPKGTPIYAGVDGIVNAIDFWGGFGNVFVIKFFTGVWPFQKTYRLICAHLSAFVPGLKVGQKIRKGTGVAYSGDSGMAIGHPHLHVEVQELKSGTWVAINPGFAIGNT